MTRTRTQETGSPRGSNVNALLLRSLLRARVSLIRLEARLFQRDLLPILRSVQDELTRVLVAHDEGRPLGEWSAQRLQSLLAQTEVLIQDGEAGLRAALSQSLADASMQQTRTLVGTLKRALPEPVFAATFATVDIEATAAVAATPAEAIGGRWFTRWELETRQAFRTAIGHSVLVGDDTQRAIRRVANALGKKSAEVATITHTTIQTAANQVYRQTFDAHADLLKGVQWVATLDNKTCPRCGPLDGKWWSYEPNTPGAVGVVADMPTAPLHPRCRCVTVPVMKSAAELGLDLAGELTPGQRASLNGAVPDTLTWEEWVATHKEGVRIAIVTRRGLSRDRAIRRMETVTSSAA